MNRVRQLSAAGLLGIVMIFELAAFALLSLSCLLYTSPSPRDCS